MYELLSHFRFISNNRKITNVSILIIPSVFLFVFIPSDVGLSKRSQIDRKQQILFERRISTDTTKVMNSHGPAINLQSSAQTVVVGHHRGYSQSSTAQSSSDPWFLQTSTASASATSASVSSHNQMPPTAPARQHKRPAPQPGTIAASASQQNANSSNHHHSTASVITQSQLPPHLSASAVCYPDTHIFSISYTIQQFCFTFTDIRRYGIVAFVFHSVDRVNQQSDIVIQHITGNKPC